MSTAEDKKVLRKRMKEHRAAMELQDHRRMSMEIMHRCMGLDEWRRSQTVHIYVSCVNNEVDTLGLIYTLLDHGIRVVVPRCAAEPCELVHIHIDSVDDLEPSKRCLMEPAYDPLRVIPVADIDLVLAPVVAFDRFGGRLGMGGGYYDNFLAGCTCPKAGLAFGFQEVPEIPVEPHDAMLDIIVTEHETIRVNNV